MRSVDAGYILGLSMEQNDAGAETIGEYLVLLLEQLWLHQECFSPKRPFGNSSWEYELFDALADQGVIDATRDEYGFLEEFDIDEARRLIQWVILRMWVPSGSS